MIVKWQMTLDMKRTPLVLMMGIKIVLFTLMVIVSFIGLLRVIDGNAFGVTVLNLFSTYVVLATICTVVLSLIYFLILVPLTNDKVVIRYKMDNLGIAYEVIGREEVLIGIIAKLITGYRNCMYMSFAMVESVTYKKEKEYVIVKQKNLFKHYIFVDEVQVEVFKKNLKGDCILSEV